MHKRLLILTPTKYITNVVLICTVTPVSLSNEKIMPNICKGIRKIVFRKITRKMSKKLDQFGGTSIQCIRVN